MMTISISSLLNKGLKIFLQSVFVLLVLGLITSCAGSPDSKGTPDWLTSSPADPAYYVGIGGSSTGNLAEDREKAAASARADLAAQISAQISSDLEVSSRASSEGDFNESVERTVVESVEQNLKSVETVDSWFSPDHGAWVYVRLSKAVWAAIVNEEIADLTLRTNTVVDPVASGTLTEAENMAALGRARGMLLSSPWGLRVKDAAFSSGGFLIDRVDAEISDRTGSMIIRAEANPTRVKFGSEVVLSGFIASGSNRSLGAFPLIAARPGMSNFEFTTDPEGAFTVTLEPETLEPGTVRFEIIPDLSAWGIPPGGFPVSRAAVEVVVDPILLALSVNSSAAGGLSSLDGAVGDWISELPLPAETVSPGQGDIDMEFAWTVFDFPRSPTLANAPYITQVGAVLTVSRNGNNLLVREIDPFKDGGLDWNQAHQRAARGLLNLIAEDPLLVAELVAAFGL
jgi:hypothetical protein